MIVPKRRKQDKVFDALERPGPVGQGFTPVEATPRQGGSSGINGRIQRNRHLKNVRRVLNKGRPGGYLWNTN
jgi:hypothetical protein